MRFATFLCLTAVLAGCDSRYQIGQEARENTSLGLVQAPADGERGYAEKELADGSYLISVQGGGVDTWTRLKDIGLWRSAQTGQRIGAETFAITNVEQKMTCSGAPNRSDPRIEFNVEFNPVTSTAEHQVYRVGSVLSAFDGAQMFPELTRRERARVVQANRMACGMVLGR